MEFEIKPYKFRITKKLDVFKQLHLSRKILPLIPPLTPVLMELDRLVKEEKKKGGKPGSSLSIDIIYFAKLSGPFAEALAELKDSDAEHVLTLTLSSVEVQTDEERNVWMPLWNAGAKMASVDDLNDVAKLIPIIVRVIIHNLGNFMDALPTNQGEPVAVSNGVSSPVAKTG